MLEEWFEECCAFFSDDPVKEESQDSGLVYLTDIAAVNIRNASDRTINVYNYKYKFYDMHRYAVRNVNQHQWQSIVKIGPILPGSCWVDRTFKLGNEVEDTFLTLSTAKEGEINWPISPMRDTNKMV